MPEKLNMKKSNRQMQKQETGEKYLPSSGQNTSTPTTISTRRYFPRLSSFKLLVLQSTQRVSGSKGSGRMWTTSIGHF